MLNKTLFISDIHLSADEPKITNQFKALFQSIAGNIDAIYILGDLFDHWIGDDLTDAYHNEIIAIFRHHTSRGLPIYFLPGNRDFLIGKQFLQKTGCILLSDEAVINLYGQSVLLMHGDTLCTLDQAYLKARRFSRLKWVQKLFLALPRFFRARILNKLKAKSAQHKHQTMLSIMDVTESAVEAVMTHHQVIFLIHGHTHRPAIHQYSYQNKSCTRIVLGAWHEKSSVLIWDKAGHYLLTSADLTA